MLRIKPGTLAVLLVVFAACPVWSQLTTAIADDGTDRIVLKRGFDEFYQENYATKLFRSADGSVGPLMEPAPCATLGSQLIEKARSTQHDMEIFLARYNLVNLWLGNLCHGKSDVLPNPEEARDWLLSIALSKSTGNPERSLHTPGMLAQLYLFGAPGVAPDYPAALALLNEEVKDKPALPALCLSYMYEHGLGVLKDAVQAHDWLERAAQAGSIDAKMLLVQAKEPNNDTETFNSYLELSKAAHKPVWFRLGLMYREGRGTQKDPCKAEEMFAKASGRVPQARKYLDQIRAQNLCPFEWKQYVYAGDLFEISSPIEPVFSKQFRNSPSGQKEVHWYSMVSNDFRYVIAYEPLQVSGKRSDKHLLDAMKNNFADSALPNTEKPISLGKYPGIELETEDASTHSRERIFVANRGLYVVIATVNKGQSFPESLTRWDASLQFLEPKK